MNAASAPFKATATAAIITAGIIAAAIAYNASEPLVWMVAYLVLVAGVAQYALGAGQAALAPPNKLTPRLIWCQWSILNIGHASVIAGTLCASFVWVCVGTALYLAAIASFTLRVKHGQRRGLRASYWLLCAAMFASAITGIVLSAQS